MFTKYKTLIICCVITLFFAGCYTSKGAYDHFDRIVGSMVGKPYENAVQNNTGMLSGREPTRVEKLENGNELNVFEDYFKYRVRKKKPCNVFVEVDLETNIVRKAYSEGEGCWMPY